MIEQQPSYCQHFEYLKINQTISLQKEPACKYCFSSQSTLWLCLAKHCQVVVCSKNNQEHLQSHLNQSRKQKKFHSIFINPLTAQIRCIQCKIQIGDLDIPNNQHLKGKQDPFSIRTKLLTGLQALVTHKIQGQLENSEGHKKISRGLVGLFTSKYNHTINAAVQFLAHCQFIKSLLLQLKVPQSNIILKALREVVMAIDGADFRAIHTETLSQLLLKQFPSFWGYKRKDPFEILLYFLSLINDETVFYSLTHMSPYLDFDQWDMFYKKHKLRSHHLIYSAIQSTLSLNYTCTKCQKNFSFPHNIQFLKLNISKKKRKTKEVQKELNSHRYDSPLKNRRKSLMNLFKEEECPITIPELMIELMKSPLHKEMNCEHCGESLKKTKLHFLKLPDILIIQIARMGRDGSSIDKTPIQLSTGSLDMGSFTDKPNQQIIYDFQSAVCIQKACLFPLIVIGQFNKQKYIIRNQLVQLSKQKMNPYILCYKKRPSAEAKQKFIQIHDDIKSERQKQYILPDFWNLQLENGIERSFRNQFVCRHNYLKPNIESKMVKPAFVSAEVYEDLCHFYQSVEKHGQIKKSSPMSSENSPSMHENLECLQENNTIFNNEICEMCSEELQHLNVRRRKEREYVLMYDKLKGQSMPLCMIAASWVKKWFNFLYNKDTIAYMPKGYPLPLSIDNKVLLNGNKCKKDLTRNEDFKIVNIYLWKFLKELYGGGPEIRYKWKEGSDKLDEQMIIDIKIKASELKDIFLSSYAQSPKKLMTSLSYIDKSSFIEEGNQLDFKQNHPVIQELQQEH